MNILIISQYFWPETFRINDLAEGLVERGHTVTVLTGKPNYPHGKFYHGYRFLTKNREFYGDVNVIRVPLIPRGQNNKIQLAFNYLSFAFFASLIGVFRCKKPDVIFVFEPSPITVGIPAIFFKKLKKVPILFWVQDLWPDSIVAVDAVRSKKILFGLNKLVNFIYQRCDYILTTSKSFFDSIKKFNISEDKLRFFPQTAESFYQPVDVPHPEKNQLLPRGFRIIFSGNIGAAQDIETILAAAELLKNTSEIKWIFLGDGSKRVWLQEEISKRNLGKTVYWLGQHPAETMPEFFSCADALLVTLKKDPIFSLTIPGKVQSYLACAKPIIASLDGEGKHVVEEAGAGFATESGDPAALAKVVLAMSQLTADERIKMGKNGRVYFEKHFQREVLLQKLENWMNELNMQYKEKYL